MDFRCIAATPQQLLERWDGDGLAYGIFNDEAHPARPQLTTLFGPELEEHLQRRRFKAKAGECLLIERLGATPAVLIVVGLGQPRDFHLAAVRQATAVAARAGLRAGVKDLGMLLACSLC